MNSIFLNQQLMQEAIQLTSEMRIRYPELYKFLEETPLFLCYRKDNKICTTNFREYVATLKDQMAYHVHMPNKIYYKCATVNSTLKK